ncbi:MAG: hypothetical protein SWK76_14040 [Actinomycetota bacterium]|nr:hypothetical protein [Actinomycetota bacterium]
MDRGSRLEPGYRLLEEQGLDYTRYVERAARTAYDMADIVEPKREIEITETYNPFDYKELHHMDGLQMADRGKVVEML